MSPVHFEQGEVLFEELDDVQYVIFITSGSVGIGYEMNKKQRYPVKMRAPAIVGGVECSYHMRSHYLYKAFSLLDGYFLTKLIWKKLFELHKEFH